MSRVVLRGQVDDAQVDGEGFTLVDGQRVLEVFGQEGIGAGIDRDADVFAGLVDLIDCVLAQQRAAVGNGVEACLLYTSRCV